MGRAVANTDRYSGRESPPHPRRRPRCRGPHSGLALTALLVLFLSAGPKHAGTADSAPVQSDFLRRALAAGDYLLRAQRTDGSFVYMRRPVTLFHSFFSVFRSEASPVSAATSAMPQ